MQLLDTHAHLYLDDFKGDIERVVADFKKVGGQKVLLPAIDKAHQKHLEELALQKPQIFHPMTGLHPCYITEENWKEEVDFVQRNITEKKHRYIAIGEIGIDLHWKKDNLIWQKKAFELQLELSKEVKLPIVIHCRKAFEEIFESITKSNYKNGGIFHCFSGNETQAKKAIDMGFLLGIGGIITYKNASLDFIKSIDLKHLVLETDAPYLSPAPYRGKRNECKHLIYIAQKIAELQGKTTEKVAAQTTQNAKELFQLDL